MVTVGILGAAAFKASFLAELRPYICIFGALISILYWRIDYRTSEYIEQSAKLARRYTQSLGAASPPANPARFGSSAATNCLFALFTAAWVGAVAFSFAH